MRTGQLLRTQAFRIVAVYVLLFALSVAALLGFTYWNTRRTLDAQTDQIIEADITGLTEEYHHFGLPGLVETVRSRTLHQGQALYLLVDGPHQIRTAQVNNSRSNRRFGQRFVLGLKNFLGVPGLRIKGQHA